MPNFDHETLDGYRYALTVARWLRATQWPPGRAHLKDQGLRASESMVLNIAEGRARTGKAGRNQYRIARGSAAETCAVLDLIDLPEGPKHQALLRRVGAILTALM